MARSIRRSSRIVGARSAIDCLEPSLTEHSGTVILLAVCPVDELYHGYLPGASSVPLRERTMQRTVDRAA